MSVKSALKTAAKTVGQFGIGVGKGAGDTLLSVKRNVDKPIIEYTKLRVQRDLNKARDQINKSNEVLIKQLKSMSKDDPRYEKVSELLHSNAAQYSDLAQQEQDLMDEVDKISNGKTESKPNEGWARALATKAQNALNSADHAMETTNAAQSAGFKVEKIAELLAPAGVTAKADRALKSVEVIKNAGKAGKVLNAVTRTVLKSGTEALATGAASLGQSAYQGRLDTKEGREGAIKEAKTAAIVSGVIKGVTAGTGEILKAVRVPQRLYSTTYKATPKEEASLFSHLVDSEHGSKVVSGSDETLADWALNKNIKGSVKKQAKQIMDLVNQNEKNLISSAEAQNVRLQVDPDLLEYAKRLQAEYAQSPYKQVKSGIDSFISRIDDGGTSSVADTLTFKRMLDSLRSKASFRNPKIGDDLIGWSDILRKQVNDIPILGQINKDYAMSLRARDALIKKDVSENNKQLIGALEAYTVAMPAMENAGGSVAKRMLGLAAVAAKRTANSPGFQTTAAQAINNLPNSSAFGVGSRALVGQAINAGRNAMGEDVGFNTGEDLGFTPEVTTNASPSSNLTKDDLDLGFTPVGQ